MTIDKRRVTEAVLMMLFFVALCCVGSLGCDGSDAGLTVDDGGADAGANGEGGTDSVSQETPLSSPDAAPEVAPWSGPCNPFHQLGCGKDEACDRTCANADMLACRPVQAYGKQDEPCTAVGDGYCAPGFTCTVHYSCSLTSCTYTNKHCAKICQTSEDCPAGYRCSQGSETTAVVHCGWTIPNDMRPVVFATCY